jgi:polar amino acid transport system permease protein
MLSPLVLHQLPFLLIGFFTTLYVSAVCLVLGSIIGMLTALALLTRVFVVRAIAGFYIDVFRSTPLLIQLVWFYYALPLLTGFSMTSLEAGVLGLALYEGAYMCEIFRSGIMSVSTGHIDAGRSLGMTPWQVLYQVVLPQAAVRMLPPFTGQALTLVKDSSILSIIAVPELLWKAESVIPISLHSVQVLTVVAALYFLVGFPLALLSNRLHARWSFDRRE